MKIKDKLIKLQNTINEGLVDRELAIRIALLTLLSGENLILIGPPGTAKSEIARRLCSILQDGKYFEYLLTKFTAPEELFGPLSLSELEKDNFHRKTEGYLPSANLGFLDEIFKANSAILNSLLSLLNERVFHNGTNKENTSILSIVGASNELPTEEEQELHALYDRFLTRLVINYVQDDQFIPMLLAKNSFSEIEEKDKITQEEIKEIQRKLSEIKIPQNIAELLRKIRQELNQQFSENPWECPSDRRFKKALKILQVSAYTNERQEVNTLDVSLLVHCLWSKEANREKIQNLILQNLPAITGKDAQRLQSIYEEWYKEFHSNFDAGQERDKDSNLLYIDNQGKKTTEKYEREHKKQHGSFLYERKDHYSGRASHQKSFPQHPDDNSYVAVYEQSKNLYKPSLVYSYEKYKKKNQGVTRELLSSLEMIYEQVQNEQKEVEKIYQNATKVKEDIDSEFENHLWINKHDLLPWKEQSLKDFYAVENCREKWLKMYKQIEEACKLAKEDQLAYKKELSNKANTKGN